MTTERLADVLTHGSSVYRDNAQPMVHRPPLSERNPLPAVASAPEPWSFKTRDDFPELMNRWGLTSVGVEVGVYRGGFSTYILKHWPGTLHLVDPWEFQPGKRDMLNTPELGDDYQMTLRCMEDHIANGRAVIHRGYSVEVAAGLAERFRFAAGGQVDGVLHWPLDWVYIDALHDRDSCLADMRAWAPLIRSGGALCGHDYLDHTTQDDTITEFGVVSAVRDWCSESGYSVERDVITTTHDGYPTFCIQLR